MELNGKVAVVTGGANGIGKALCRRFARDGAQVAVLDREEDGAHRIAAEVGGLGRAVDVSQESEVRDAVRAVEQELGRVDLFCSNAGVGFSDGHPQDATALANDRWQLCWDVNLMAHVFAARAVLPGMIERGSGYLLNVVSAAGLLSQIGDAAYSTTKHAAIGFAESLAITHGDQGIRVSVVCPQAVATRMIGMSDEPDPEEELSGFAGNDLDGVLTPDQVAECVVQGVADEQFLILPHPQVRAYMERKTGDYDRWLGGMRKLRRQWVQQEES